MNGDDDYENFILGQDYPQQLLNNVPVQGAPPMADDSYESYFNGQAGYPQPELGQAALEQMGQSPSPGQAQSFMGGLGSMKNQLIGMGLGMMRPAGQGGWAGASSGWQAGAGLDQRDAAMRVAQQQQAIQNEMARRKQLFLEEQARQPQIMKTDSDFGPQFWKVDKQTGKVTAIAPEGQGGGEGAPFGIGGILAPGVTKVDPALKGDDYLNQFSE